MRNIHSEENVPAVHTAHCGNKSEGTEGSKDELKIIVRA